MKIFLIENRLCVLLMLVRLLFNCHWCTVRSSLLTKIFNQTDMHTTFGPLPKCLKRKKIKLESWFCVHLWTWTWTCFDWSTVFGALQKPINWTSRPHRAVPESRGGGSTSVTKDKRTNERTEILVSNIGFQSSTTAVCQQTLCRLNYHKLNGTKFCHWK